MNNRAFNNFYILEPFGIKNENPAEAIYGYENSIDVKLWRGNTQLLVGKVVSTDNSKWCGSITNHNYSVGDLVVYNPTCVIKTFSDETLLVRDDAIICLFDKDTNAPAANENEVVVKVYLTTSPDMDNIVNGFPGVVMDIQLGEYWDEETHLDEVKVGDDVIVVNPYQTGTEAAHDVFRKVSTTTGFYIISEVDAIACKVESEK